MIKGIGPSEYEEAAKIFTQAFVRSRSDYTLPPGDTRYLDHRCAFDDSGKIIAMLRIEDYQVWLNSKMIRTGGIGSVCSLLEHRGGGVVSALMDHALMEMHQKGMILSVLFPFSKRYYGAFGYEACLRRNVCRMGFDQLRQFKPRHKIVQYFPGDDTTPFEKVYDSYCKTANLRMCRDGAFWTRYLDKDPYTQFRYTYFCLDDDGEPMGYVVLDAEKATGPPPDCNTLKVSDLGYLSGDGLYGVLSVISGSSAQYGSLVMQTPPGFDLMTMLPEPAKAQFQSSPAGLARILDAKKALETLRADFGGEIVIGVTDLQLEQNNRVFSLSSREGRVVVRESDAAPDMEISIAGLTQLVTGYLGLDEALCTRRDMVVYRREEALRCCFVQKPTDSYIDF